MSALLSNRLDSKHALDTRKWKCLYRVFYSLLSEPRLLNAPLGILCSLLLCRNLSEKVNEANVSERLVPITRSINLQTLQIWYVHEGLSIQQVDVVVVKVSGINYEPLVITIDTFNKIFGHGETLNLFKELVSLHVANTTFYGQKYTGWDQLYTDL